MGVIVKKKPKTPRPNIRPPALRPRTHPTNCLNCGAALKSRKCDHCGSIYVR